MNANDVTPVKKKRKRRTKAAKPKKVHMICGIVDKQKLSTERGATAAWKKLVQHIDDEDAIPYTPRAELTFDSVIMHSKFGIGIVADMLTQKKAEILFEDQVRRMVCNI